VNQVRAGGGTVRWLAVAAALMPGACLLLGFANSWSAFADSLSHFRLPLLALVAVMIPVLAAQRAWRAAAAAVMAAVIGAAGVLPVVLSNPAIDGNNSVIEGTPFTLVQLNLLFTNRSKETAQFIEDSGAEIVTLQEVSSRTRWILSALKPLYPFQLECKFAAVGGVAVLSKFPPISENEKACTDGSGVAWLRISVHGRPVSVATFHLHWPYPFGQWGQIDRMDRLLGAIPRPVIAGGDFNAAPWSRSVSRISEATGTELVGGLRFTLHKRLTRWGPVAGLPIDHVLAGKGIRAIDAKLGPDVGSDHRPVVIRFVVN
jgi:endonuclease/exonuclease/phosphatase (EEP) superfamily protein YafD